MAVRHFLVFGLCPKFILPLNIVAKSVLKNEIVFTFRKDGL